MKIKEIKLEGFRRFKNLTIKDIPEETRLVVMIGPNGSGKSSVFDALHRFRYRSGQILGSVPDSYLIKIDLSEEAFEEQEAEEPEFEEPEVKFHTDPQDDIDTLRKSVHMRSAYRNDALDSSYRYLSKTNPLIQELRFRRLAENDQTVASNYDRILGPWIERMSGRKKTGEGADEIEDDLYGELRDVIRELFKDPQLTLTGMGNPKNGKIFEFDKGTSQGFSYENLSSGEKSALDLILDIIVAKFEFNDTVFCIDEPEAHIHTKLQGPLLDQLYKLIPVNSQLWIATHSIGMVRKAQDLWREGKNKGKDLVVFLDFGREDLDFDNPETIKPTPPDPNFWERVYEVALGDLAELVITERTAFCESRGFDSECYHNIFFNRYSDLTFEPIEGKGNVIKSVKAANRALGKIAKNAKVIGIIDGDTATSGDRKRGAEEGIRILSRKTIESYLLDDEVLKKLCEDHGKSDKISDLLAAKQKALDKHGLKPTDKLKLIVQDIHGAAQNILKSVNLGINQKSFMMDILAPCIQPGMNVYEELHKDIFGE